jgi:uncharacterized protein YndB with AHSA1/START domain
MEKKVVVSRFFDAPRSRVFEAWTRAEHLPHWFGPAGFTVHSCEADARAGGVFRLCLRSPDGRDFWVRGEYREVMVPERLVIACTADDEKGIERLRETIQVTFAEEDGRTKLTVNVVASGATHRAAALMEGMDKMWADTVHRLNGHLVEKRR